MMIVWLATGQLAMLKARFGVAAACLDAHVAEEELNLKLEVELELVLSIDLCH